MKKSASTLRIGVSMRATQETGYPETRDALDRRWHHFLDSALPGAQWMPIPNLGTSVSNLLESWNINGLILTGGQDLGHDPVRDATERTMLDWALARSLPVLGVCRGLQLIQDHLGGVLIQVTNHVATRHGVDFLATPLTEVGKAVVNSFHAHGIAASSLVPGLLPLALDPDGLVEGAYMKGAPVAGIMWHPEREDDAQPRDVALLHALFSGGA